MTREESRYFTRWLMLFVFVMLVDVAGLVLAGILVAMNRWASGLGIWLLAVVLLRWWQLSFRRKHAELKELARQRYPDWPD